MGETPSALRTIPYSDAVYEAITEAMRADPSVFVLGVGADDPLGTRGATGLVEKFGRERVVGTPLSEDGMTGVAIGAAMAGMRPVQVHGRVDFTLLAMNQLVNVAAKARYMYGGHASVPLVVRATIGRSWGQGAQHSQGLHSFFAHVPGLRVVMPSNPEDAKGTMMWALTESRDPCIFLDHRMLHATTGTVSPGASVGKYFGPEGAWREVGRRGADLTIVATSYMVLEAKRAVGILREHGITCSLFDPLWIRPLSCISEVAVDVARTMRLLVVDCGWPTYGFSAEVVASVSDRISRVPIQTARMGFAETPCPTSRPLEMLYYPSSETIAAKAYEMVRGTPMPRAAANGAEAPEVAGFRGPF
jgi:pyruvate/2-oxoglutarate/acetoin dehydrogenase E1 component